MNQPHVYINATLWKLEKMLYFIVKWEHIYLNVLSDIPQCSEEKLWVNSHQQHSNLYEQGTWRSFI